MNLDLRQRVERDALIRASGAAGVELETVEVLAVGFVRETAASRFIDGTSGGSWEHLLRPYVAVADEQGVDWVEEYVISRRQPVILFLWDGIVMFEARSGVDLVLLLDEYMPSEFCLTNNEIDYLISFSHEGFVYVAGTAAGWFEARCGRMTR